MIAKYMPDDDDYNDVVKRINESILPKKIIKSQPKGRNRWSKPKLTCMEGIQGLVVQKGLTEKG